MSLGASATPHKYCHMNLEVSSVIVANKSVSFGTNKAGDGLVIVSQKRLGEITGLKGAALKRAHFNYRIEAGKSLNAGLSAGMASGEIIAKSVVPTKGGGMRAVFDRTENLNAPVAKKDAERAALLAEISRLRAELAAK